MFRSTMCALGVLSCATALTVSAQNNRPEAAMAGAASKFLASLDAPRKSKATIPFNDVQERLNWHFVPKFNQRKGLPLKEMTPDQQKAALALLRAGLSEKGYQKAGSIRELEGILRVVENNNATRDRELYYFTVFGEPSEKGTWGFRYEGHHCSLNWTVINGKSIASTPQFFGTNPGEVRVDVPGAPSRGTRVLGVEEDLGRALVKSLNAEQKKQAVLADKAPSDILTSAQRQAAIQEDKGVAFKDLSKEQQGMLLGIIREYANAQPQKLARERLQKIRMAGIDNVKFAWMGGLEKNQGHYYRIQGSTFLIEYDNTQNDANHVHCVWRDFKGDFGMDLLAMHYQSTPHRVARAK